MKKTSEVELVAMAMLWNPEWVISPQEAWVFASAAQKRRLRTDARAFLRALRGGR